MLQVQRRLLVREGKVWDYAVYSNGKPMFKIPVEPLQEYFEAIIEAASTFEAEVQRNMSIYLENIKGLPVAEYRDYFEPQELTLDEPENF